MEASHRPKQANIFEGGKIQNVNTRIQICLSDSKSMGLLNRPFRCPPSHPRPPNLKEGFVVHLQVSDLPVHLSALQASDLPTSQ